MSGIPQVVLNYLDRRGLEAIPRDELAQLRARPEKKPPCPYPLFEWKFGYDHRKLLGVILEREGDPGSGLSVVQCVACHNITLEVPVPLAASGPGAEGEKP